MLPAKTTADRVALVGMHDWTDPMLPAIAAEWGLSVFSLTRWRIRAALTVLGVRTAMSGGDDTGLGPCATSAPL